MQFQAQVHRFLFWFYIFVMSVQIPHNQLVSFENVLSFLDFPQDIFFYKHIVHIIAFSLPTRAHSILKKCPVFMEVHKLYPVANTDCSVSSQQSPVRLETLKTKKTCRVTCPLVQTSYALYFSGNLDS